MSFSFQLVSKYIFSLRVFSYIHEKNYMEFHFFSPVYYDTYVDLFFLSFLITITHKQKKKNSLSVVFRKKQQNKFGSHTHAYDHHWRKVLFCFILWWFFFVCCRKFSIKSFQSKKIFFWQPKCVRLSSIRC